VSDDRDDSDHASPPAQPLARLVGLLTSDSELDARWGARRQGERIPFCKPLALTRIELVSDANPDDSLKVDVEQVFEGWALNICHGGLRVITEEALAIGDFLGIEVTSSGTLYAGKARVCWVRKEADGVVAGLQFAFTT
jgi:hypothetical protein